MFAAYPVLSVHIFISIPLPGEEGALQADDLSGKECGEGWVFLWTIKASCNQEMKEHFDSKMYFSRPRELFKRPFMPSVSKHRVL